MTSIEAQRLTLLFLIVVTIVVIGYDVLIIRAAGPDASISRVLCKLFGALADGGHRGRVLAGDSDGACVVAQRVGEPRSRLRGRLRVRV
jgi:hypothetical protein